MTRVARWPAMMTIALPLMVGCGATDLIPPAHPDPDDLYWALDLDHHAVAIAMAAPYKRLQLTATPRNFLGEALVGLPAPRYQTTDVDRVAVTADGMLVAVAPTTAPVAVIAQLTYGNLNHTATAMVSVVDIAVPPVLTSLSIQPVPPDSAKVAIRSQGPGTLLADTLDARAVDSTGSFIPLYPRDNAGVLPLYFRSSDPAVARVDRNTGEVVALHRGTTTMVATTNAFGVAGTDTLVYRTGWPVATLIHVVNDGTSGAPMSALHYDITIGTGGAVAWGIPQTGALATTDSADIIFADDQVANVLPIAPILDRLQSLGPLASFYLCRMDCTVGGNITFDGASPNPVRPIGRHFPTPGVYEYHGGRAAAGVHGRVVVVDER